MNVVLFVNPRSGRGRAASVAGEVETSLRERGYRLRRIDLGSDSRDELIESLQDDAEALIVTGGDGTVHHAAGASSEHGVPVYHIPMGTENLFAREFGMTRSPDALHTALERFETTRVDMGECDGRTFLVMASIGPDASVVCNLARARKGSISQMSYMPHIVREALRPKLQAMRIHVDGKLLVDGQVGQVVVATMRQYASRIDPCPDADPSDGLLDVVFFPARTTLGLVSHLARSRFRVADHQTTIRATARQLSVEVLGEHVPLQLDGEGVVGLGKPLDIRIRPGCLPVLLP